ncbi:MAG: methylated-DNA--[protein]-cysteine S-methyltransferase [Mycobacteriales bacterium]
MTLVRRFTVLESPLGDLLLVSNGAALGGLYLAGQRHGPTVEPDWQRDDAGLHAVAVEELAGYFAGERTSFDLPLAPVGTDFQLRVWLALRDIPFGQTESYGDLAARIGRPTAARAVGLAVGHNPLSIVVGCHRVLGRGGALTGYAGGLDRKRWLLAHEAEVMRGMPAGRVAGRLR